MVTEQMEGPDSFSYLLHACSFFVKLFFSVGFSVEGVGCSPPVVFPPSPAPRILSFCPRDGNGSG